MDLNQTQKANRIYRFDTLDGRYFLVYDDPQNIKGVVEEYMSLDSRKPNKFITDFNTLNDLHKFVDYKANEYILSGYKQHILKNRNGDNKVKELDIIFLQKISRLHEDVQMAYLTLQATAYYNGVRMTVNDIVTRYRETGILHKSDLEKMNTFYEEISKDLDISRRSS